MRRGGRAGRRAGIALPVQYADYAIWQRELLGDADDPGSLLARQVAVVAGRAGGGAAGAGAARGPAAPVGAQLPRSRGAAARPGRRCTPRLAGLAREQGVTLFMVVQAALAVLLSQAGRGGGHPGRDRGGGADR